MVVCGAALLALSVLMVLAFKWLDRNASQDLVSVFLLLGLPVFIFVVIPGVWWGLFFAIDKVQHAISRRMSRSNRQSSRRQD